MDFLPHAGQRDGNTLGNSAGTRRPRDGPLRAEECVFYTTWSASGAANPASKNQAEKMLAEPEVRQFVEHLEKWIRHSVSQPASDPYASSLSDATFDWMLLMLRHQTTMFVSELKIKDKKVSAKGGMVVALGADAPAATRLFHENVREFFLNLNVEALEVLHIDGQKWYRVKPKAEFPTMIVGIKDSHLIVAVGEGSLEMIVERMQKPAPEWLVKARRISTFDRPAGLTYINVQRLLEVGPASTDPNRKQWVELLGLAQSPWLVSATGLVGPDVVTRTVLPIEGQPRRGPFPGQRPRLEAGRPGGNSRRLHAGAGRAAECAPGPRRHGGGGQERGSRGQTTALEGIGNA